MSVTIKGIVTSTSRYEFIIKQFSMTHNHTRIIIDQWHNIHTTIEIRDILICLRDILQGRKVFQLIF